MSDEHVKNVTKHYRSLFSLPGLKTVILMAFVACCFSAFLLRALMGLGVIASITLGLMLTLTTFITTFLTLRIHVGERIINLKRSLFLSLIGVATLGFVSYVYSWIASLLLGDPRIDHSVSIGASFYFALNLLVLGAMTKGNALKKVFSALIGPVATLMVVTYLMSTHGAWRLLLIVSRFFTLASFAAILIALSFVVINKQAKGATGFATLTLFRAFISDWLVNEKEELEKILSELGENSKAKVQIVAFRSGRSVNGIFIVPNVHPGPFKDVGGSLLPTYLNRAIRDRYGVVSLIFHGASNHSLDPTSYQECVKVVNATINAVEKAKPVRGLSKLVCKGVDNRLLLKYQVLGVPVFFVSNLLGGAEDLPPDIATSLRSVAIKAGFNTCIVIDTHNRYGAIGTLRLDRDLLTKLVEAAEALISSTPIATLDILEAGFASTHLKGIGWAQGIGDAGLMFSALKVNNELYGYVSIDGNNLVAGLRERIIALLRGLGYTDAEVCTTDTHGVTALISGKEYYAVGEGFDPRLLLNSIKELAEEAMNNLKPVTIHLGEEEVTIKVIGGDTLTKICDVILKSVKLSKRVLPLTMTAHLVTAFIYLLLMV